MRLLLIKTTVVPGIGNKHPDRLVAYRIDAVHQRLPQVKHSIGVSIGNAKSGAGLGGIGVPVADIERCWSIVESMPPKVSSAVFIFFKRDIKVFHSIQNLQFLPAVTIVGKRCIPLAILANLICCQRHPLAIVFFSAKFNLPVPRRMQIVIDASKTELAFNAKVPGGGLGIGDAQKLSQKPPPAGRCLWRIVERLADQRGL